MVVFTMLKRFWLVPYSTETVDHVQCTGIHTTVLDVWATGGIRAYSQFVLTKFYFLKGCRCRVRLGS